MPAPTAAPPLARKQCPEAEAPFLSKLFLLWVVPLVHRGWKSPLQDRHLWELRPFERAAHTTAQLLRHHHHHRPATSRAAPRMLHAVARSQRRTLLLAALLKLLSVAMQLIQPLFISRLLRFLQTRDPLSEGLPWAFGLLLAPFVATIIDNQYYLRAMRAGMRVRSAVQGAIYAKSLRISPSARASSSLGEVVNLMQLDTQRVGDFFQFANNLWSAPLHILVTVALLFNYIGVSAVIGLLITLSTVPLQSKLMSAMITLRKDSVAITDRRVKLMNEILQGIKCVKFYAWEQPFADSVDCERKSEVAKLRGTVWLKSAFMAIMMVVPTIIAVVTFAFFTAVFNQKLDPPRIFTGLALLNQLRMPVMMLPITINSFIDARIGLKRVDRFMLLEDTDNYSRLVKRERDKGEYDSSSDQEDDSTKETIDPIQQSSSGSSTEQYAGSISITSGEFEWSEEVVSPTTIPKPGRAKRVLGKCNLRRLRRPRRGVDSTFEDSPDVENAPRTLGNAPRYASVRGSVLRDINLHMRAGQLTGVFGRVGSGKSSLIHAILGEMRKVRGQVSLDGSVAYVAQTAWIFNSTLRNNIIFGKEFDEEAYKKALQVSALVHDIRLLPAGDMTAIGEKGINLSGGQKQRVSIARAVYADADVYLFDDPLSALDAHVGQEVFDKCISNRGVLHNRLRVLITNQAHLLPECDNVIFLKDGAIRSQGSYSTLSTTDTEFQQLINEQGDTKQTSGEDLIDEKVELSQDRCDESQLTSKKNNSLEAATSTDEIGSTKEEPQDQREGRMLMQEEERTTGNVILRAYLQYSRECGGTFLFSLMLLFYCFTVALSVLTNWWLAFWAEEQENGVDRGLGFYLGIYFALAALYAAVVMLRSMWYLSMALQASTKLHKSMLKSVLRAPMGFFDTTPIGRIISRFSRDMNVLDELLPQFYNQMLSSVLNLIAAYVFIGVILPLFIAVAVPITIGYFALQRYFNRSSIELKRLDAISKSPIYAHFSETLGGLSTLRAYGKQEESKAENMKMIDINQRAFFSWLAANRWFSMYLEMAGSLLIFATALFGVLARDSTFSGKIGLSLTYALQVTGILGYSVRSITELEGQMSSVERANYYSHNLPQEAPTDLEPTDGPATPENWPSAGRIDIDNVQMRYRPGLSLVLRGVSFSVAAGEKVGVVGRTGSGKSSLMIAILRMVELSGGTISVDGVDLRRLGLNEVRRHITIIPQDPVIFSGTIRFNLDPFSQHSDSELWDALEKSHLKDFVQEVEGGLDAKVSEYGENLSAGQRQVICLTRALLRNSRILILDEASSSLDFATDRMIQETIREHLKDATILTIAHRLFTLTDYDKIVVMDNGMAAEFGRPSELLADPESKFSNLVDAMGQLGASKFRAAVGK